MSDPSSSDPVDPVEASKTCDRKGEIAMLLHYVCEQPTRKPNLIRHVACFAFVVDCC